MKEGVVAFAFGTPATIEPNMRIATMAMQRSNLSEGRIFTQRDVPISRHFAVNYITEPDEGPPPTLRIARWAVKMAADFQIDVLWIACAEPHVWRCKRDMRYAIQEAGAAITLMLCPEARTKGGWFCSESTLPRTQNIDAWRKRERILEMLPMFVYTRVAN